MTGRDDDRARVALNGWRERHPGEQARWNSIPSPVRRHVRTPQPTALREAAAQTSRATTAPAADMTVEAWWEPVVLGGGFLVLVVWVVSMIGIGKWTVWGWIWG